jgi:hypothetical protein
VTRSARWLPLSIAAAVAVAGLCGCATATARSANNLVSSSGPAVPSTPLIGIGTPLPWVCQSVLSVSDLSGAARESGAIVEGTSPDKSSTFNDADASQFNVTKVLKAIPGVDPTGTIEIVFAPPNSGDFLPAGKYLLFLEYNAIGKDYSIASSSFRNVLTVGEFLINGDAATEQRCSTPDGDSTKGSASANAAPRAPPMSTSALEGWVGQLALGQVPASPAANPASGPGSPTRASSDGASPVSSIDGAVKVVAPGSDDQPQITQTDAQIQLENSTLFGDAPLETVPHLELARVTVTQGSTSPRVWNGRLAWVVVLDTPVEDLSLCPIAPANPDPPPAGPRQHIYAVDATGIGDGIVYTGPGISCGRDVPPTTDPLAHLWSAPWHVTTTGPTSVTLGYQPPPCGTEYQIGAVSLQPYQIAMLYAVPFAAQDCPSPTPAPQTLTVPGNYSNPTPAPPNIEQPRFGYVRLTTNGLLPELRREP